ncbi:HD-GYP domain-containing protein [Methylobacterium sp. C25]|uniref:HD-GYP domain-containing protein n=1 Tax=Methylobacterium sp. C25 TaxID=2721622 RepID=UPI001F39AAD8|nr:HD-GYP domain-containing protein [Methylobacterium sp. C25]MCE4223796.1 HD-GYP domain-containing protein [Methylobacterium sp. C25]
MAIVLITDNVRRSRPLIEALQNLGDCRVVQLDVDWNKQAPATAIVADCDFTDLSVARCLKSLKDRQDITQKVLGIAYRNSNKALQTAMALGLDACIPFYTEPHVVVAAVQNLINPNDGDLNAAMRRCANKAATAVGQLFESAGTRGRIDLTAVDDSVDPILTALEDGGLARWLNAIEAHDKATYQHSLRVAGLSAQFATYVGFPDAQRRRLVRAALVHDLGKSQIPRELLLKRGSLNADELAIMRTHTTLGYDVLRASSDADSAMLDAVRHHHELLDGSGYPDGLSGDGISDIVRLLTICDIYSALTERRSYKPAMASDEAVKVLQGMTGKVEPRFVRALDRSLAA